MRINVISVDASIGAGKTTLINELMKRNIPGVHFELASEPVDLWMNIKVGDDNILTAFYKDKKEVALPFQLIALLTRKQKFDEVMTRAKEIVETTNKTVYIITERTIHSDRYIFAKMLHQSGDINEAGIVAYGLWNDYFASESSISKTVYINISPDVCHQRISERARPGEDVIPLDYLKQCQKVHDEYYDEFLSKTDCLVLDNTLIPKDTTLYTEMVDDVVAFIVKPTES